MFNLIKVAKETIHICECGYYEFDGKKIELNADDEPDFSEVKVYSPDTLENMRMEHIETDNTKVERCSTLYASISSDKAKEMYSYNTKHLSSTDSHYMLLSPDVWVFRNYKCELLKIPYKVGIITVPAPNRHGKAIFTNKSVLKKVMTDRIRHMLNVAHDNKYRYLVLGAWGCGAFGNKAEDVADYFYKVLVGEKYSQWFDEVCFAVLWRRK